MFPSLSLSSVDQLTAHVTGTGGANQASGGYRGINIPIAFPGGDIGQSAGGSFPWWAWVLIAGGFLGALYLVSKRK